MTDNQARPEIRVPRRNGAGASLAELTLLVRVPSNPDLTAVYTDEQAEEARQYAAAHGGTVVALPVDDGPWGLGAQRLAIITTDNCCTARTQHKE